MLCESDPEFALVNRGFLTSSTHTKVQYLAVHSIMSKQIGKVARRWLVVSGMVMVVVEN
jgi:predicted Kef-type K+ transport protein